MIPVLLLGLLAMWSIAPARAADVLLKAQAVVPPHGITLADVASVTGEPADVLERLGAIRVARSPRVGYRERIGREELERIVAAQAKGTSLHWGGSDSVALETSASNMPGVQLSDAAAAHLSRTLDVDAQQSVSVRPTDDVADIRVPQGQVSLRPRPLSYREALRRRPQVWVDVLVDNVFYCTAKVSFELEVWRQAWVAKRDLERGRTIAAGDLERRLVDVAAAGAPAFEASPDGVPMRLTQSVRGGAVLLAGAVESVPEISQGDSVVLRSSGHGLAIELPAVALSTGRLGQRVLVKPRNASEPVRAAVTAVGIAEVTGD